MREISPPMTRMYWARSGAVMPASFSTARAKPTLFRMRRGVVQPVGVRDAVVPRALLAHLLEAAVQVADLDVDIDDGLAVELEVELDGAVRRRMRRPHLDFHDLALAAVGLAGTDRA